MNLFDIEGNKVVIHPEALLIKEFKEINNNDKSVDKKYAKEDLAFVVFWCHYKSQYKTYDEDVRESKIIRDVITQKNWAKTPLIDAAIAKYKELHSTYSMGLLEDVEYGLQCIRKYFRKNADKLENDLDGKITSAYLANAEKAQKLIVTIRNLKEIVEREIAESNRIRGGGKMGNRELPKEKRK